MYGRYVYIEPPQGLEPPPIDTKAWLEERGLDDEVVRLAAAVCVSVLLSVVAKSGKDNCYRVHYSIGSYWFAYLLHFLSLIFGLLGPFSSLFLGLTCLFNVCLFCF